MKIFGAFLFGISLVPSAMPAQGTGCNVIQDSTRRVACVDKGSGVAKSQAVRPPKVVAARPQPLTTDQVAYRANLDHAFLEAGVRLTVEAISNPKGSVAMVGTKMPVLLIWNDYLDRPTIYQIQQKLNVIDEARKANFKAVIFYGSAGTGSMYRFDITKPGQTCSRDLCF
jgi:hypothetical protein